MQNYQVLRSTLEGIFGAAVGFSSDEARSNLLRDLEHQPFRDALSAEMTHALADPALPWQRLLDECNVACFDNDDQARLFVVDRILKPVNSLSKSSEQP